jgi:magnesium-protoporphyrin O-methyltransferase
MTCCQCEGIESKFDERYVQKKLAEYRRKGPKDTTRILLEAIKDELHPGMTLLDIGGGVGDIQHELLAEGVSASFNCEASSAYLEASRREAKRLGQADRMTDLQGNFVEIERQVPEADIVTLDRVICCYHDMPELVTKSLSKAGSLYGMVIPRDRWWVKLGNRLFYNLRFALQRCPFRVFVYPIEEIEAIIQGGGLRRVFERAKGAWWVALYSRA